MKEQNLENLSIVGNPNRKRKSNIDFGLADELNKYYANPKNFKKKEENLEKKAKEGNGLIIKPSGDLCFVTDIKLYNEIVEYLDKTFPKHKDILSGQLSFDDAEDVMKGSSTYITTGIGNYLKSINSEYGIANQIDLEQNLDMFKGRYIDSGLALRNITNNINKSQAIHLFNQLKQRGLSEEDFPIYFNLRGLILDNNLNFNLTDESSYKLKAECLNWENGSHYSIVDNFGIPKEKNANSRRRIFTANKALSGVFLYRDSDLDSGYDYFARSDGGGRVVLAKKISGVQI